MIAKRASTRGAGLYDTDSCGRGPAPHAQLQVHVNWDAAGVDRDNPNGEWIEVRNLGSAPVKVGHWRVKDSDLKQYRLPSWAKVPARGSIFVHPGRGHSRGNHFYWGLGRALFDNEHGDGGYLFDPQGDLRAAMVYPCLVSCTDPNVGALEVVAHPRRPESVLVRNISGHPVDLYGYELALRGSAYDFGEAPALAPGQTLQVDVDGDPADDTALHRYWGLDRLMLPDSGGWVRVQTFSSITLACDAWGSGSC